MKPILKTIIGLAEQADREPEKEAACLSMIKRVIDANRKPRRISPVHAARALAENERAHRNWQLSAEQITNHQTKL